jgi:2-polyprenyl-3-methyl-5-hydroxy-6-metoxy-1,4-benzoquinol methylase
MPDFTTRSYAKELLDRDNIPFAHIAQNMRELDYINQKLGGHRITLKGFQNILKRCPAIADDVIHIVEMGCGGGDNLRVLQQWAQQRGLSTKLTGIDINEECIAYARKEPKNKGIHFIHSDYQSVQFQTSPHLLFSSLFCHHFTDDELVAQLRWMQQQASAGFFINDLHRHPLAYYSIKGLTQLFSQSYLVKNDAPLSVRRGFVKRDWEYLLTKAGVHNYTCHWQWAFRWLITVTC